MGEILADKMVAFANTPPGYMRKRDAWDMMYLLSRSECDREMALEIVPKKRTVYGCDLDDAAFSRERISRLRSVAGSDSFEREMLRFMPRAAYDDLFGTALKRRFAIDEACALYDSASSS